MIEQFWSGDFVAVLTKIELVNNLGTIDRSAKILRSEKVVGVLDWRRE